MTAAFKLMENAFDTKRQEWYGIAWEAFDWWGLPDRELPEQQRQDLLKWSRG